MKIEELNEDKTYKGNCHDCGKQTEVRVMLNNEGQIEISGGAIYKVKQRYNEVELFLKCDACFAANRILKDYKKCDIYSRAVGYLRPVNQWNKGKREEFKHRVLFKNIEGD